MEQCVSDNMTTLVFIATLCNKFFEKAIKNPSPTLKHIGTRVEITIETDSKITREYIDSTINLIESTPYSRYEYFTNVTFVKQVK